MAGSKRQRHMRDSTAAYAASQPLFDVLCDGVTMLQEQKTQLTQARDLVQGLHIKLAGVSGSDDAAKYERYLQCVVKAWQSATESYSAIFEELTSITAANASEGRAARTGHVEFKTMAMIAQAAMQAAISYTGRQETEQSAPSKRARIVESSDDDLNMDDATTPAATTVGQTGQNTAAINPRLVPLLGKRRLATDSGMKEPVQDPRSLPTNQGQRKSSRGDALEPAAFFAVPEPAVAAPGVEAVAVEAERRTSNRAKRRTNTKSQWDPIPEVTAKGTIPTSFAHNADGAPKLAAGTNSTLPEPNTMPTASKGNAIPGVEYEDVSAEVTARLKAKEAKKRAKLLEKKRKRESIDSTLLHTEPVQTIGEKPKRKKARADVGTTAGDAAITGPADATEKRKAVGEAEAGRKRRKKAKA